MSVVLHYHARSKPHGVSDKPLGEVILHLVDAYHVEVFIHGFFVDSFGAYYKV